jgi:hypothetical protein
MGTEGRALLVQSFRTIGLEDVQESALRIYRKYLIQLRTASMAAEEEAAAFAAAKETNGGRKDGQNRPSLEKSFAPGWDGYAEEVIAQWNEKWKGRSREARRSRRLTGGRKAYSGQSADGDNSGQPSTVGDEDEPHDQADEAGQGRGLTISTQPKAPTPEGYRKGERDDHSDEEDDNSRGDDDEDHDDEEHDDFEEGTTSGRREKSSAPSSPISPRMRKRTGTGLSALLNPFLTRLMRTETTVVELPTLTINTTTIEEAAVLDDSEEDDSEDDDDEEDEDSDDEDEDDDEEEENDNGQDIGPSDKGRIAQTQSQPSQEAHIAVKVPLPASSGSKQEVEREEVVAEEVLGRSIPTVSIVSPQSIGTDSDQSQGYASDTEAPDGLRTTEASNHSEHPDVDTPSRKNSTSSSLSSSWDQITKKDLQKQGTNHTPIFMELLTL